METVATGSIQRCWGTWIQSAQGEDGWRSCPENCHEQVKLAQRPLGPGVSLVRLQVALEVNGALAKQLFPLPEALWPCATEAGLPTQHCGVPAQLFSELRVVSAAAGEAEVVLQVDPKKLWYQVLAANLLVDGQWLEAHRGTWLVRRGFPDADSSAQVITSTHSIFLDVACVASPLDGKTTLITMLHVVPVEPLQFRMKYLLRASLSRNLHSWFTWLFSESVVKARAVSEAFYVTLSIENVCDVPPLLPSTKTIPRPFSLQDWQFTEDDTLASYLRHFIGAAGLGDLEVLQTLDGKQLAAHQAALRWDVWQSIEPLLRPIFENASIAYRRIAYYKLYLTESNPELLEDANHVAEKLNACW